MSSDFLNLSVNFCIYLSTVPYNAECTIHGNDRIQKGKRFAFQEHIYGENLSSVLQRGHNY